MKRTLFLLVTLVFVSTITTGQAETRPNIVVIPADDLGWKDLGCYGSEVFQTPHLDRLAAGGMRFTSAYAASCVCSPTRVSIMTGKYPAEPSDSATVKCGMLVGGNKVCAFNGAYPPKGYSDVKVTVRGGVVHNLEVTVDLPKGKTTLRLGE